LTCGLREKGANKIEVWNVFPEDSRKGISRREGSIVKGQER
jgi:hypothetical protein